MADVDPEDMDADEGGFRYSDHHYHDIVSEDDEADEPEVELSSRVGRCPAVRSRADEDTCVTKHQDSQPQDAEPHCSRPHESVDLRSLQGNEHEDEPMPDYDDEHMRECFHHMGSGLFNGKPFEQLCMDDLNEVYFPTVLEAEKFYYLYARIVGFSVRRSRREMDENGLVVRRLWVCSKEGKSPGQIRNKKGNDANLRAKPNEKRSRRGMVPRGVRYTRVNCHAEFSVKYCSEKGMYMVKHFVPEHCHDLAQPNEVHFLRSNRKIEDRDVAQVQWLHGARVSTSMAFEKLVEQAGRREAVGFTIKDLYNKLYTLRKKSQPDGDAQAAMTWMNMRGIESKEFYCKYSLDGEGRLANLFWRDHQSLLDYKAYSDVIIMDTTYKTNLYRKPLVVFVGCNNHRATIVFGFAIIRDEREDTYEWVFENFLESMDNQHPASILTDGDEAIRNVVGRLMPSARHRLCAWHIGRNIGQNVKEPAAQKSLGKMIYVSLSVPEWEAEWHSLVQRHGLEDNEWVTDLFRRRERWAEAFFRGHFFGGMCSTQRVEGMHSKMKQDIDRFTRISDMMPRMERSVGRIRDRVLYDNFRQKNSVPVFETHMKGIEADACRLFTHDIFIMIKAQIMFEKNFVIVRRARFPVTSTVVFYLFQYDRPERRWSVEFQSHETNPLILCSCRQFESDGIPCCHIFCVMKDQRVFRYPKSLETIRWTKSVGDSTIAPRYKVPGSHHSAEVARYSALVSEVTKACSNYSFSEEGFREGMTEFAKLVQSSAKFRESEPVFDASNVPPSNVVRDPEIARTKGMHGNLSTGNENVTKERKNCGNCNLPGHNRRTCKAPPAGEDPRETGPATQ